MTRQPVYKMPASVNSSTSAAHITEVALYDSGKGIEFH